MPWSATAPNQEGYNVFAPNAGAVLARPTGKPGLDFASRMLLLKNAMEQQAQYGNAYQGYLASADAGAAADRQAEAAKNYMTTLAALSAQDRSGAITPSAQIQQDAGVNVNQGYLQAADTIGLDATGQKAYLDRTAGLKNLSDVGRLPPDDQLGLEGALDTQPVTVRPYINPQAAAQALSAQASMKNADAHMIDAVRGPASSSDDGVGVKATYNSETGEYTFVSKDPEQVKKYADDPRFKSDSGGPAAHATTHQSTTRFDTKTGKNVTVSAAQIAAQPSRYAPARK